MVRRTVTWNDPVAVFPAASVAAQRTVVVPIGKVLSDARSHSAVTSPSTRSVAVQRTAVVPTGKVAPEGGAQSTSTGPSTRSCAVGRE
jgi:hypothetical protein